MRPDLHQALSCLTDEERTEILGGLLQGTFGGSEAWADAIWPVEKAFVDNYAAIERAGYEVEPL